MWVGAIVAVGLFTGVSSAAEAVSSGKVKAVNADKKEFVLADSNNKDWTFKLGSDLVINRGGKEGKNDLEVGDPISVYYDKGTLTWTAHYILVQAGATKDFELVSGTVKGYESDKKQVDLTDENGKDLMVPLGAAKVRMANEDIKPQDLKIGDHALALMEKTGDKSTLRSLMITRK
jgi:hypothetical protein